jgi:hypothetical protein
MFILLAEVPTESMTPMAWLVFALVAGFVWGGFALLLFRAVRREGEKR